MDDLPNYDPLTGLYDFTFDLSVPDDTLPP